MKRIGFIFGLCRQKGSEFFLHEEEVEQFLFA